MGSVFFYFFIEQIKRSLERINTVKYTMYIHIKERKKKERRKNR